MSKHNYLIRIQFLGFRYCGWQKQTNAKTVQEMVDRTFQFIFKHSNFKTLGAGRTDSKVSANEFAFQLFVDNKLDCEHLVARLNKSFPADIRALSAMEVPNSFNVLQSAKSKEYIYNFCFGEKPHPTTAPYMVFIDGELHIELMKKGARLFQGIHNFEQYCYKPSEGTNFIRTIDYCEILINKNLTGSFFPKESWTLHVHGKGFMRYQIRIMMANLIKLGRSELSFDEFKNTLNGGPRDPEGFIAVSSGLCLNKILFDELPKTLEPRDIEASL